MSLYQQESGRKWLALFRPPGATRWERFRGPYSCKDYAEQALAFYLKRHDVAGSCVLPEDDPRAKRLEGGEAPKPSANGRHKAPRPDDAAPTPPPEAKRGWEIIAAFFAEKYKPVFKSGDTIHCGDGSEVPQNVGCRTMHPALMEQLKAASDAPFKGKEVNEQALPGFFRKWAPTAWAAMLDKLPDEERAELGSDAPAAETFRRMVRAALLTPVMLGGRNEDGVRNLEKRSLADWSLRFAKDRNRKQWGRDDKVRSYQCWAKLCPGTNRVMLAVTHDLMSQVGADRALVRMTPNRFAALCRKYGVGEARRDERPQGVWAITLSDEFVQSLLSSLGEPLPERRPQPDPGDDPEPEPPKPPPDGSFSLLAILDDPPKVQHGPDGQSKMSDVPLRPNTLPD